MANAKIVSILDHTVRTSREDLILQFEDELIGMHHEIKVLQRVAVKLSEDVEKLKQQEEGG